MLTKIIDGCVSSQRIKLLIPNPLSKKQINKLLVLIEINKCEAVKRFLF